MAVCHLRQFPAVLLAVVLVALVSTTFSEKSTETFPTEPVPTEPNEEASSSTYRSPNQFNLSATSSSSSSRSTTHSLSSDHQSQFTSTVSVGSKNGRPSPANSPFLITAASIYKTAPTSTVPSLHMSISSVSNHPSGNSIFPSETQSSVATSSQATVASAASSATSTVVLKTAHISTSSSFAQRTTSSSSSYTDTVSSASQSFSIMPNTTKASPSVMQNAVSSSVFQTENILNVTKSSSIRVIGTKALASTFSPAYSSASQTKTVSSIAQSSTVLTNATGHVQGIMTSSPTKTVSSMAQSSTILPNTTTVVQDIMTSTIYPSTSVCIDCTSSTSAVVVGNSTAFRRSPPPTTLPTITPSSNSSIAMEKTANTSYFLMPSTALMNMTRATVNRTAVLVIPTSSLNQSTAFVVQTSTASASSMGSFSTVYSKQLNMTASSSAMPRTSSVIPTTPPVLAPSAPPQDVQAYSNSSTSIMITWRPPPSGTLHGALTKYEVFVQKRIRSTASPSASYSSVRTTVSSISASGTNPSPSTSVAPTEPTESPTEQTLPPESLVSPINAGLNLSIVVSNLEKFSLYEVRVRAVTVLAGPFSAPVAVRTDEDVPSACRNISLSNQNSTSVMVHWTRPLQINGILLGYKVYYGSGSTFSTQKVASNKMAYFLEALVPFTQYIINVTALTKKGEGEPISTSFKTLQAAPSAIRNLTGLTINSTAARISWTRPEFPNGQIEYIVMMRASGGEESILPVQIYQGPETQYVATGLKPVTRYIYSVYSRNVRYRWQSTVVEVEVVTSASEPSGPPLDIQATVKNSTSILVEWQPPSPSLRNGFIQSYVVQYSSDKTSYIPHATRDNSTRVLLTSLSPYTLYYIKVQAVNLAGAGPFSELVTNRTSEDAPSPPTNFTARSVNATCILVTWEKPRHLNGETVGYKLYFRLTSSDSSQDGLAYLGESTLYLVSSLQEHANYTFTLYAYNVKYEYKSASVLAMETTHPAAPSGPPQNTRAVTLSSRSILVQWDPPKALDINGIITAYVVNMRRPDGTHENRTLNGNTNKLISASLLPYTVYVFTVQAMNKVGAGPRSPPVSNKTYEEVPGAPMLDQVTNLTSTVLQISWLPPANSNGKLTAFNVCWQLLDLSNQVCKETDATTRTFNIFGLNPYSLYNVTVAAATSKGYGPSVFGVYRTMEGVPSKPQNLQGWNVSSSSIFVTWTAPANSNGILTSYNVAYRPKQDSSTPDIVDSALSTNITLRNLKVFTVYEICVNGSTSQGFGDQACKSVSTDEGAPGVVSSLVGDAITPYSIHLSWKAPSFPNGNIGYTLYYYLAINPEWDRRERFPGSQVEYYVRGLNPYANYNFSINAYNLKKSLKGPARVITVRTKTALPSGPPLHARLVKATTESLSITWDPPAKPNGPIKLYRLIINNVKTPLDRDYKIANDTQYTFVSLDPGQEYGIKIGAIAAGVLGTGPLSKEYIFSTMPSSPPPLPPVSPPDKNKITAIEITIELHKAKDINGKVRFYQVIVLEVATNDEGHPILPHKEPKEYEPSELVTYQEARKRRPQLVPYIAAEFAAKDFHSYRMFRIGDARNYSISARKRRGTDTHYYNGPLDPGTYYTAFQRAAVSRTIYTSSSWIDPVSTTASSVSAKRKITSSTNTGLIVGLCVTFILIIIVIVIVFAFLWRKRRFDFGVMLDDENEYTGSRSLRLKKMRSGRRSTSSRGLMGSTDSLDNLDDGSRRRQPIPIEDFANLVRRMHTDGDIGFSEEYELVQPNDEDFTWHHSLHSANKYKNRYANIVSYDHSRVLLTPIEGVAGSDYINANYIDGYSRSSAYIACQGPLPETFDDFWRMIWEQGTATIVMLTQLEERGRRKCDQYWPDRGTRNYGMIRVTASETSHMSYYILRTFILSHKQEEEEPRQIKQYHFTSWPDHGVPTHPAPLLSLVRTVASANPATAGPMVVHCSAGVGRTGTYITLDAMLQKIEKEQIIDVFEFVKQMRTKRNIMVQTEAQYVFIYDALNEAVSCGVTEFEAKKFSARLRELREVDPDTGRSYMEKEFLRLVRDERHPSTFKNANLGINSSKNRYANILPYEKTRVPLKMRPGEVGSDYINASYIDGYCRLKAFIATQAPVPNTFEDFWRMIWEQKSSVLVMLTREEEAGKVKCHRYWPSDGTRIFGNVLVELSEEVSYPDYVMRQFSLTHTEDQEVRTVRQYQYIDWPDVGLPESGVGIIDLIGQVEKWQQQSSNSIITVHCSGGVGRTGVFCAVSILIERVKAEGVIDVFQTVQSLRLLRPAMVQTIEQYEFCYSTLQEYLDSFDLYSNFQ